MKNNQFMATHKLLLQLVTVLACWILAVGTLTAGTHVWSGAVNGFWSNPGNWSSGGAPSVIESEVDLRFPPSGLHKLNTNDLGTLYVRSIVFTGSNYTIRGAGSLIMRPAGLGINIICNIEGNWFQDWGSDIECPIVLPNGTYTVSAISENASVSLLGPISGPGSLLKFGAGRLGIGGDQGNTFTGGFRAMDGVTRLYKSMGVALPGPVVIGASNSTATVEVSYARHHQIADAATVEVLGPNSRYDLDGNNDTIASLKLMNSFVGTGSYLYNQAGEQIESPGILTVNGDITVIEDPNDNNDAGSIYGILNLGNQHHDFITRTNSRLILPCRIQSTGTNGGFSLRGGGSVTIYGSNTFSGPLYLEEGKFYFQNNSAFGSSAGATYVTGTNLSIYFTPFEEGRPTIEEPLILSNNFTLNINRTNIWTGSIHVPTNLMLRVYGNLNSSSQQDFLTLAGAITGSGEIRYFIDQVTLAGTAANTFSGRSTLVGASTMILSKTNVNAISGELVMDRGNGGTPYVRLMRANQIADSATINFDYNYHPGTGVLDLNGYSDTIGALIGKDGEVKCGTGILTVGASHKDFAFDGLISGSSTTNLVKIGNGIFTLKGTLNLPGNTLVNAGTLLVNDMSNMNAHFRVASTGRFGGANSKLGSVTCASGTFIPGGVATNTSFGLLEASSWNVGPGSTYRVDVAGLLPGVNHDQFVVNGNLNLNNQTLFVQQFGGAYPGHQFTILKAAPSATISGSFLSLPEGSVFNVTPTCSMRITYQGGPEGKDVVLTQVTAPAAPTLAYERWGNGIQISGVGTPGWQYRIQSNYDLSTTNWVTVAYITADQSTGAFSYTPWDNFGHPMCFYRLVP